MGYKKVADRDLKIAPSERENSQLFKNIYFCYAAMPTKKVTAKRRYLDFQLSPHCNCVRKVIPGFSGFWQAFGNSEFSISRMVTFAARSPRYLQLFWIGQKFWSDLGWNFLKIWLIWSCYNFVSLLLQAEGKSSILPYCAVLTRSLQKIDIFREVKNAFGFMD